MKLELKPVLEADDEYTSSGIEDPSETIEKKRKKRKNKVLLDAETKVNIYYLTGMGRGRCAYFVMDCLQKEAK